MKKTLEKLWNDYLLDECALISSDEERSLTKKTSQLHEKATNILNKDQKDAVEKYIDALCEIESFFAKKAFIKGCEFAVSFLTETVNFNK